MVDLFVFTLLLVFILVTLIIDLPSRLLPKEVQLQLGNYRREHPRVWLKIAFLKPQENSTSKL